MNKLKDSQFVLYTTQECSGNCENKILNRCLKKRINTYFSSNFKNLFLVLDNRFEKNLQIIIPGSGSADFFKFSFGAHLKIFSLISPNFIFI